jgi:lipoprotein-releasing system ATP-binding protein
LPGISFTVYFELCGKDNAFFYATKLQSLFFRLKPVCVLAFVVSRFQLNFRRKHSNKGSSVKYKLIICYICRNFETMVSCKNITKSFGSLEVLKGIDISISPGEIVAIVGPSGAGKTTLLQILGTLDKPDSGEVHYQNIQVNKFNDKKLASFRNKNIGFVFQFHQLLPEFTALENVMIPALIGNLKLQEAEKKAREILDFMNLSDRTGHKPAALSGGEKQRVAVARALVNTPAVIFADEPSGSLDTQNKEELHRLFFDLRAQFNQTFVIVTHDESLASLTDRTIYMKDGRIRI